MSATIEQLSVQDTLAFDNLKKIREIMGLLKGFDLSKFGALFGIVGDWKNIEEGWDTKEGFAKRISVILEASIVLQDLTGIKLNQSITDTITSFLTNETVQDVVRSILGSLLDSHTQGMTVMALDANAQATYEAQMLPIPWSLVMEALPYILEIIKLLNSAFRKG